MSVRSPLVRSLPCVCCEIEKMEQPNPTEEHHLNLGGYAGKKRLGDDYSVPLCGWHHRSVIQPGRTASLMDALWGPSMARTKRQFRKTYGPDDYLLKITNERLGAM